jgi:hypothetical protein
VEEGLGGTMLTLLTGLTVVAVVMVVTADRSLLQGPVVEGWGRGPCWGGWVNSGMDPASVGSRRQAAVLPSRLGESAERGVPG